MSALDAIQLMYPSLTHYGWALEVDASLWEQAVLTLAAWQWRWIALVALTSPLASFQRFENEVMVMGSDGKVMRLREGAK